MTSSPLQKKERLSACPKFVIGSIHGRLASVMSISTCPTHTTPTQIHLKWVQSLPAAVTLRQPEETQWKTQGRQMLALQDLCLSMIYHQLTQITAPHAGSAQELARMHNSSNRKAMTLTIPRKPVILYSVFLLWTLILALVIVTALQSLHSPTSYEYHASDPNKQLRSYRHKLEINVTAHTPFLTALNQASTLDTLRQHQLSSQSSLDQLTSYLTSNLPCTFRMHDTHRAGDTVTAIGTAHSLAI